MFKGKVSVVNVLTAVGKLLIPILFSINAVGNNLENPKFFSYEAGNFTNRVSSIAFGWFKTLDDNEKHAYYSAINHAVFFADNGEHVQWSQGRAWGLAMPAVTWSTGNGYCRRLHIQASKYGITKTMSRTACYQNGTDNWTWYKNK
jgi:hypothetical protein